VATVRRSRKGKSPPAGPPPDRVAEVWAKGKLPPAILILGPEAALREQALVGIRKAAFADGDGGMNWIVLHGPERARGEQDATEPATVLDEACTGSLFAEAGEPKVVVVRKAELLLESARNKAIFERALPELPDCAVVVFEVAEAGRLKSTRLYKWFAKNEAGVACDALANPWGPDGPDSPLTRKLAERAAALGLKMDAGAAMALIERSGRNLGVLSEELAKLSLALGASPREAVPVSTQDVERVCSDTRLPDPFEFAAALAERDLKRSLETLGSIFEHGLGDYQKPGRVITNEASIAMRLLGVATWKLTQLQDLRAALDEGAGEFEAFKRAKLFGARRDDARRTLRRHSAASLRRAVEALLRANLRMRTGSSPREALDGLIWEACSDHAAVPLEW